MIEARDRRPDWHDPEFWRWAIRVCDAAPAALAIWFPYVNRQSWCKRKATIGTQLGIEFPGASHNPRVTYPPDPPEGWPVEAQRAGVPDDAERPVRAVREKPDPSQKQYKESVEILGDGSYKSDRLLEMSEEQCKDQEYLLQAHGFDVAEWEIVTAKNNIWNVFSKDEDGTHNVSTLYSSKITVRPKRPAFDIEAVVAAVRGVEPVTVARPVRGDSLLELGAVDMHFGNSTLEWYGPALERIVDAIESETWQHIVLPIGSDLFHVDNFKNTTSNGTQQSSVAWPEAWADALTFWSTIIETALVRSVSVFCYYVIGNHDESMSWAFCQMLAAKYPQVTFDLEIAERKVHIFGEVAIGMTHGDCRTRKDIDRVFVAEFPEFARATVREVHAAHYHHEVSCDEFGVVVRSLSTAARTDKWHREEGYVGARKRFQLFEFDEHTLTRISYV